MHAGEARASAVHPARWRATTLVALLGLMATFVVATSAGATDMTSAGEFRRTFYLAGTGNDTADGLSPATAWRSLDRVNRHGFAPGDRLLLEGGTSFPGMIYLDAGDAGDPANPVVIASFGSGRATIRAVGTPGIYAYNTGGVTTRDLIFVGDGNSYRNKGGISFYTDLPGDIKLGGVSVSSVEVSGFRNGVEIGGANGASGYADVVVADVQLHDNMEAGLITYGPSFDVASPTYAHERVSVLRVSAFRNVGDPTNLVRNTGNGIVLGSVSAGSISASDAHDNGSSCIAPEGPAGIWTFDSRAILIEGNVSYRNRTGGKADGDGFDLDQNVSSSTVQNNRSYENDGAGYLVWTAQNNSAYRNNVVRYNSSNDDSRKIAWYGGITVSGRTADTQIYGNTVSVTGTAASRAPALRLGTGMTALSVRNNSFLVRSAGPVVAAPALSRTSVTMQGNSYDSQDAPFVLQWGQNYASLDAWRLATGQEAEAEQPTGDFVSATAAPSPTPTSALSPTATTSPNPTVSPTPATTGPMTATPTSSPTSSPSAAPRPARGKGQR